MKPAGFLTLAEVQAAFRSAFAAGAKRVRVKMDKDRNILKVTGYKGDEPVFSQAATENECDDGDLGRPYKYLPTCVSTALWDRIISSPTSAIDDIVSPRADANNDE